jgi:hypothetical protein
MSPAPLPRTGVTFPVNDVPVDPELYPLVPACDVLKRVAVNHVEAWSCRPQLIEASFHPLVDAIHYAFAGHKPLVLSPDHIWLVLCQGFAEHVKLYHEELRSHFTASAEKVRLFVRRDHFIKGSPENSWNSVFPEFADKIREHSGSIVDVLTARFSTTTSPEQAAFEITLMDAVQYYFEFVISTCCGIPSITLEGSPEDWHDLIRRFERFRDYGLSPWVDTLLPILQEFTRPGENREFWQSIYKYHSASGGGYLTGWIGLFFPYREEERNPGAWGERPLEEASIGYSSLPDGISTAPFTWDFPLDGLTFEMEFVAGFLGITQDPRTYAVRPEIGWLVCEAVPEPPLKPWDERTSEEMADAFMHQKPIRRR